MAYIVQQNESNASYRVIYLWCMTSNGTTPSTQETGGQPQFSVGGVYKGNTSATLSAISAAAGEYAVTLTQSETSLLGQGIVRYSSGTALETATPFQVVAFNSGDSMRLGLFALPNAAAAASGGVPVIGTDYGSSFTVGISAIKAGTYSAVTVGSLATIAAGDYSSSVTFGTGAVNLGSGQFIADRVLSRSIAGGSDSGRTVGTALYLLRNRTTIDGSTMTVYQTDDATSAWTASLTTGNTTIASVDPAT